MNRILVTGATGFLGGAVISRLLDDPLQTNLLLLVRGDTAAGALFRVKQNLEQFAIPPDRINRLTEENILLGDLSEPNNFINDRRLDTLTQVLNCAAVASFGTNPLIWKVNVEGTFQLASRMARVPTLSRFVHVGTAMSCIPDPDSLIIEENRLRSEHRKHVVEYTRSKAEIETRMQTQLSELPLVIALPSIVVGHSTLGCIPSSSIFWVFGGADDFLD